MENVGPIMDEEAQKSGVTAQQVVQEVLSQTAGGQTGKSELYIWLKSQMSQVQYPVWLLISPSADSRRAAVSYW